MEIDKSTQDKIWRSLSRELQLVIGEYWSDLVESESSLDQRNVLVNLFGYSNVMLGADRYKFVKYLDLSKNPDISEDQRKHYAGTVQLMYDAYGFKVCPEDYYKTQQFLPQCDVRILLPYLFNRNKEDYED